MLEYSKMFAAPSPHLRVRSRASSRHRPRNIPTMLIDDLLALINVYATAIRYRRVCYRRDHRVVSLFEMFDNLQRVHSGVYGLVGGRANSLLIRLPSGNRPVQAALRRSSWRPFDTHGTAFRYLFRSARINLCRCDLKTLAFPLFRIVECKPRLHLCEQILFHDVACDRVDIVRIAFVLILGIISDNDRVPKPMDVFLFIVRASRQESTGKVFPP